MRKDEIVSLIESHVTNSGGNKRRAYEAVGKQLGENIKANKVNVNALSFKAIFEACVKEAGYDDVTLDSSMDDIREAVSSSAFPNITKYVIASEMLPPYERRKEELSLLFSEGTSTRSDVERIGGFSDKEGVERVAEQGTVAFTDFHEKYAEIHLDKYQKAIALTKEAIYNDNTGELISRASNIGDKFSEQFEQYLIQTIEMLPRTLRADETSSNLLNAKFDGTAVTNAIFYSTDHSSYAYMGKQTNKNLITSKLDTDGLNDAFILFPEMKDDRGDKINASPKTLLVHTNKVMDAWQLTKSPLQYDTSNNAANPWGAGGLVAFPVVNTSYMSDQYHWYFGDFKKQVKVLWWERPNVTAKGKDSDMSFSNDVVMAWKFSAGLGIGMVDYKFICFANATT